LRAITKKKGLGAQRPESELPAPKRFRVQGSGSRVQGPGSKRFRVQGAETSVGVARSEEERRCVREPLHLPPQFKNNYFAEM